MTGVQTCALPICIVVVFGNFSVVSVVRIVFIDLARIVFKEEIIGISEIIFVCRLITVIGCAVKPGSALIGRLHLGQELISVIIIFGLIDYIVGKSVIVVGKRVGLSRAEREQSVVHEPESALRGIQNERVVGYAVERSRVIAHARENRFLSVDDFVIFFAEIFFLDPALDTPESEPVPWFRLAPPCRRQTPTAALWPCGPGAGKS